MFKSSKKDLKEPVTLGDFVEFADFVADNVAMKDDLKSVESKLEKKITQMEIRLDSRIDKVETRLENKITEFKDEILTGQDAISKKIDKLLTEDVAKLARDDRQDEEIKAIQGHLGLEPVAI